MNISDWGRRERYTPLPNDWQIIVADIVGSTQAIERGRYKDVNVLGASCVIAACNAIGDDATHFVFGGDGAVFAVPPAHQQRLSDALLALAQRAEISFGLTLRLGAVSVEELRARGTDVLMAHEGLQAGFKMSIFSGGGVALADTLVKQNPGQYGLSSVAPVPVSLDGLECRWNDVPAVRGKMMALLIRFKNPDPEIFQAVIGAIQKLLPAASPVRKANMPLTWPPQHLWLELSAKIPNRFFRVMKYIALMVWTGMMSVFVKRYRFDVETMTGRYCASVLENTDHVKYDDVFGAVIDVTQAESQAIEQLLLDQQAQGILDYGIHFSEHALMTCFVRSLEHHMHFVDASGGGYAMAARQLKSTQGAR